jgi:hypothetical protein
LRNQAAFRPRSSLNKRQVLLHARSGLARNAAARWF